MDFNRNTSKRAQEIIFSGKVSKPFYPDVPFDNNPVNSTSLHKHVGMIQDYQWSFEEHLKICIGESVQGNFF